MGPAPDLGELPESALLDVPPDECQFLGDLIEVVLRDELGLGLLLHLAESLEGVSAACGAVAVQGLHVLQAERSVHEHHPVVPGELGVGCGVEEVASHECEECEDHGVSGTEGVYGPVGVESLLGGHDHVDELGVPVLLHQGDDSAHGVDVDVHGGHPPGAVLPEVGVDGTLCHTVQHHVPLHVAGLLGPLEGDLDGFGRLFLGPVGFGEDVQDGSDVGSDGFLEFDDLLVGEFHLAVHVALEGTGVGHDDPGEVQHLVESQLLGLLLQIGGVLDDVGVCDQGFESELVVQLPGGDRVDLGVDDGEQGGCLHGASGGRGEPSDAGESVPSDDLEHVRGIGGFV